MKILAIMGSYRKGKTIDTLIDKAIEGAKSNNGNIEVEKISLIDQNIEFCKGCMTCFKDDPSKEIAKCVITDDMDKLNLKILEADGYIFGTPVFIAHETAIMKKFLERICYRFAKPAPKRRKIVIPKDCPMPRSNRKRKAIIITSSGIIKPRWKKFCDDATPLIKGTIRDSLNAKVIGTLYAGAIMKFGVERYYNKAYELGKQLTS
jgi:NAD(P)H-dependent FMN reductase